MKIKPQICSCTVAIVAAVAMPAVPANAQVGALEEIVVTAQRREENLQKVPLSISAIGAEEIEKRGIVNLSGLNAIAPNVMFRQSPTANLISVVSIRGSVAGQPAIWVDPPVGLYLNGVYLGKSQGSVFDVVEIERVEVLRGPQGTLFGRNTEGGAISFITRKPSGEFEGKVGVELGNFDHKAAKLNVHLPRFGMASVSVGLRKEKRDGWAENLSGPDMGAVDQNAGRLSVMLDPSERLRVMYDFDYSDADNTPPPVSLYSLVGWRGSLPTLFGPVLGTAIQEGLAPYVVEKRPRKVSNHGDVAEEAKTVAHALTLGYDVGQQDQLKYIYSSRSLDYYDSQDSDGTPATSISSPRPWSLGNRYNRDTDYEQESHELQWTGTRGALNYVLGAYYFSDEGETNGAQHTGIFGLPEQRADYASDTEAWALFGQADYALTERWTATLGARYTEEEKKGWSHRFRTQGFGGPYVADILPRTAYSETFSDTTPMASLSFAPTDDLNFYARVAKGFKSGGFSAEAGTPTAVATPFDPQTSVAAELGVKSMLLEGRLRLNASVYHTKIEDQQLTQLIPGTTQSILVNAGESIYKGAEIEATWLLADEWRLQVGYGYLDAYFDSYPDNALNLGPTRPVIETANNRVAPYAPEHTLSVYLEGLLWRTGVGDLKAIVEYSYTAETYLYAANKNIAAPNAGGQYVADLVEMSDLTNLNARLLLSDIPAGDGSINLSLWVRNLTDEDEIQQGIDYSAFRTGLWQAPRTWMITGEYRW